MKLKALVVKEDSRMGSDNTEYLSVTLVETGSDKSLMQHIEYSLAANERVLKGKLLDKTVEISVQDIADGFHGRPRFYGSLRVLATAV